MERNYYDVLWFDKKEKDNENDNVKVNEKKIKERVSFFKESNNGASSKLPLDVKTIETMKINQSLKAQHNSNDMIVSENLVVYLI